MGLPRVSAIVGWVPDRKAPTTIHRKTVAINVELDGSKPEIAYATPELHHTAAREAR